MKLSTSLVAVKKITCNKPRSIFADDDLEKAAQLILESEGVINPIVVRRINLQSYEVVDGDFEYYAAARAREIDPRKGEMIGVFIIEPENEDNLTKQVKLFRNINNNTSGAETFNSKDLEKFLNNLESRFEKITTQLLEQATTNIKLENEIKELKKQIAKKVEPLEFFQKLPQAEISYRLLSAGLMNKAKAEQIAETAVHEREKEQFKSINDLMERIKVPHGKKMVRGISSEKMLDIVMYLLSDN
ncbi:hypothetical protein IQ259_18475 [Fortiea sp. LEGE XX443]|uniref:ParB N-terminal domain-containing protein n=1 Tax=Fortiea sp. LEGE XX443 TaxID=1828611 RepID=UPI00187F97F4|nr:ParB N-terminal domain-containing protein [Fortiea sp. LEGE XX443]MBE9006998.1 hypothetical protein [Fortiea sp. LEGE XX443]